jgi:ferrochelatase
MPSTALKPPADGARSALPDSLFDAILLVSFGGPEGMDDVMPFLENVTRGRGIPRERLEEVAHHYELFGGVSPINAQNRALIDALRSELDAHGIDLPIWFGNRNWHPLLPDTLGEMRDAGVRRALAIFTSGFSCYSGCRQYRENLHVAQEQVGPDAPEVVKARMFYNHPGFIGAVVDILTRALGELPEERRGAATVVFTAHSIPQPMADASRYEQQLTEASRLVAEGVGVPEGQWQLVYQSRSGAPHMPWLGPDICDHLRDLAGQGVTDVVVVPIGFVSDHMEVLFDLDEEARLVAEELGLGYVRASSVGTHPLFVGMLRELVQERLGLAAERRAVGRFGPSHDTCPVDCCLPGTGKPSPWDPAAADWQPPQRPGGARPA